MSLMISAEMMGRLSDEADTRCAQALVPDLSRYSPYLAAVAGQAGLAQSALSSLRQARAQQLVDGLHVRLWAQLAVALGTDFALDPLHHWLASYLRADSGYVPVERVQLAHWHACRYMDLAWGTQGRHYLAFLRRCAGLAVTDLSDVGRALDERAAAWLGKLHPQRMPFLDMQHGQALLAHAREQSPKHGLDAADGSGEALLVLLMFSLGHGVLSDPLFPWVGAAVQPDAQAPTQRVLRLFEAARTYLLGGLRWIEEGRA